LTHSIAVHHDDITASEIETPGSRFPGHGLGQAVEIEQGFADRFVPVPADAADGRTQCCGMNSQDGTQFYGFVCIKGDLFLVVFLH
jgi:hypothetical protein